MGTTRKSIEPDITVFQILEAITGELPCHASPNWNVSYKNDDSPNKNPSVRTREVPEDVSRNVLR